MKKFFIYAAFAALLVPFVSCNNKVDYGGSNGSTAKIEKAKYADQAKKVTVKSGTAADQGYQQIELTDGGRYIITRSTQETKADDFTVVITGTYTVQNNVYVLDGFGSIEFGSNGSFTIKLEGGTTVTGTGEEEPKLPSSDFANAIAHTWKIDKVDLSVNADGKNIGFVKDGCNLEQIGNELLDQAKKLGVNVNVNVDKLKGYNVTSVSFTTSSTFIVEFSGAEPFKANVSGVSGFNFKYKLEIGSSNEILNAEADCKFEPQTEKTAWLTVKVNSDDFNGKVIFMMTIIDK